MNSSSMPTTNKTTHTDASVTGFIHSFVEKEQKKQDSLRLIELMREWSGFEPQMYGPSIIGFGTYHYKYASGREGGAPLIAFSPRKAEFSLYVTSTDADHSDLLDKLGKFKMSKACIYFKKLDDLDLGVLEEICRVMMKHVEERYGGC
jgi:hypothetical protein